MNMDGTDGEGDDLPQQSSSDPQGVSSEQPSQKEPEDYETASESSWSSSHLSSRTEQESSDSLVTSIPSDLTITESSSDLDPDDFLGPLSSPIISPTLKTYKITGDNVNRNIDPRERTSEHGTRSLDCFHQYAVRDRIDISSYSNTTEIPDLSDINVENLLLTSEDEAVLCQNFSIIVARTSVSRLDKVKVGCDDVSYHKT